MSEPPLSFHMGYRFGSHAGPDAPAHCRACGRQMRTGRRRDGYDRVTGESLYVATAICSAPWLVRSLGFHDKAEQDQFGDWPWL